MDRNILAGGAARSPLNPEGETGGEQGSSLLVLSDLMIPFRVEHGNGTGKHPGARFIFELTENWFLEFQILSLI